MKSNIKLERRKKRVFEIIEVGAPGDYVSRIYDFAGALAIVVNLIVTVLCTFDEIYVAHQSILLSLEHSTALFFAVDYVLRVWTARYLRPDQPQRRARWPSA